MQSFVHLMRRAVGTARLQELLLEIRQQTAAPPAAATPAPTAPTASTALTPLTGTRDAVRQLVAQSYLLAAAWKSAPSRRR